MAVSEGGIIKGELAWVEFCSGQKYGGKWGWHYKGGAVYRGSTVLSICVVILIISGDYHKATLFFSPV